MRKPQRRRHWRQRWDYDADMVFLKRLRMGDDPEKPFVLPGDPVTQEFKEKLGPNRLRRWWDSHCIGLAEWYADHKVEPEREEPVVVNKGNGRFEVTMPGSDEVIKVHGKKKLEALLAGEE